MENGAVYNETTEPEAKPPRRPFGCTRRHLQVWRLLLKALQAILSLLAVICEEIVEDCIKCGGLYFFEFTSCSAFLLSLLVLCVYCTEVYETFGKIKYRERRWSHGKKLLCKVSKNIMVFECPFLFIFRANSFFPRVQIRECDFWAILAIGVFFLLASIVLTVTSSGTAVENAACVFGFLASVSFLAEVIVEHFYSWKQNADGLSENPGNTQSATENQPLNKQSQLSGII